MSPNDPPFHLAAIAAEYERRLSKNPRYSMRAYARSLGMHFSTVSRLMSGKTTLSITACPKVLKALNLSPKTERLFVQSVLDERKRRSSRQLGKIAPRIGETAPTVEVDIATFEQIADRLHMAVLEGATLDEGSPKAERVAAQLGVSQDEVDQACERLARIGLLKRTASGYEKAALHYTTRERGKTTEILKKLQRSAMTGALDALEQMPLDRRCMTTMVLSGDESRLATVKAMIDDFMERLSDVLEAGPRSRIFQLNVQFFPVEALSAQALSTQAATLTSKGSSARRFAAEP